MSDHIPDPGKMVSARDEAVERALMAAWCNPIEGVTDEDAFLTALAAAGHVIEQDWQPIATAPRDGTEVLVYARVLHPEKWGVHLEPMVCAASYHPDAGWCVCEIRDATHWRPLPAPPAAAKETKE
jgi:hypothetical protein